MTTPLIMLFLMTAPYVVVRVLSGLTPLDFNARGAAAVGLGVLFIFTGVAHFVETEAMSQMLPPWVPERVLLVYLTGVLELSIALGFLLRKTRRLAGGPLPQCSYCSFQQTSALLINHIPVGGHAWGPVYLFVRAPLQLIILFWVYWFTIKPAYHTKGDR